MLHCRQFRVPNSKSSILPCGDHARSRQQDGRCDARLVKLSELFPGGGIPQNDAAVFTRRHEAFKEGVAEGDRSDKVFVGWDDS